MNKNKAQRERFDPDNLPLLGSLGILALGDIGFEAWRKIKAKNNRKEIDEKDKLLLIGWDAADWDIIWPLISQGKMPALKKLMANGVYGNMSTMSPPYSPMLWTSVVTGKTPDKHGILGFIEVTPDATTVRPVTTTSRKTRALWNIFHNQGLISNLVGWWPSFPAEPINGTIISDRFSKTHRDPKSKPL